MKVAYYSPLPPERTGIAEYSALLMPALAERVELAVARPGRFHRHPRADLALYHVGNNPDAHGWIADALEARPGLVVLHEFVLHHLLAGITIGRRDGKGYIAAMERELGLPGALLAIGALNHHLPPIWETQPERFPLATAILDLSTGVIVHSRYVEELVLATGYRRPVWRIPHPAWPVAGITPADVHGDPLIGCFGNLNSTKRIPQLLEAFATLLETRPGARLLLAGAELEGFELPASDLGDALIREDYLPEDRMWSLMAACDVLVNLRVPTMGETSGSAIRGLALGKPMIVSDLGWFAELPDDVALKVPTDAFEVPTLVAALEFLATDATRRDVMGAAALALIERDHRLDRVADAYAAALAEAFAEELAA